MDRSIRARLEIAIDEHERSLLAGTPTRRACGILRAELARILDDADEAAASERQTQPDLRVPEDLRQPSSSQVLPKQTPRGLWDEDTRKLRRPGIDRGR